jgi:uncharacterized protein
MKKLILAIVLLWTGMGAQAQSYTVDSVPNTKLINNSYVSNPDNLINATTVIQIDQRLTSLEQQTTAQVAVVLLQSIGENTAEDFAQSLFVKWGIGKATKDNGLLILFVADQKTIRFHTGFGLEGVLPDVICKRIQTQKMVPNFKGGNTDAGMLAGIDEVIKILTDPAYAEEIKEPAESSNYSGTSSLTFFFTLCWIIVGPVMFFASRKTGFSDSIQRPQNKPNSEISKSQWWLFFFLLPILLATYLAFNDHWFITVAGLYGYFALLGLHKYYRVLTRGNVWLKKGMYQTVYSFYKENSWMGWAIFFPIPFAFLIRPYKKRIQAVREHPRDCHNCSKKMTRLSEATEDEHLPKEHQFEENLQSVDYDVWICSSCNSVSVEQYVNEKTKYAVCPKCKTYAFYTERTTTLTHATTSSTGEEETIKLCKYCNNRERTTATIPMISTSSDSSSSSSDSGGSYGGGDSGGGGSSSSW